MKKRDKLFLIIINIIIFGFVIALVKAEADFTISEWERESNIEFLSGAIIILLLFELFVAAVFNGNNNLIARQKEEELRKREQEQFQSLVPERSRIISQNTKMYVWQRDGGKCVECGSKENLEYDHIIPFSKGGSNSDRNIQLLCESCNRSKSSRIQ